MATEIGQAYIQLVPSARGISGAIQKQIDPEATSAGQSAGLKLGTGLKVAALASVAALGASLGKIISSSISEGADLQQSLGGIETLFKGSANKVKKYADQAYRTSGLSANGYMENVTSFSASLLQSLGGNTSKAADQANMAMIDMSDNSNKMGTSMESIQDAYKGFAKSNYTMLDNLSLGYGGTKTEMQRLLADATKLTGVKYDINNLSDVYSAIHAVQGELGITGTTAKESASTFSGSLASMKAAASNVLGKMALGQDIGPSLNALGTTTSTFLFKNFIPMVANILKSLPQAISAGLKAAGPALSEGLNSIISSFGGSASSKLSGMFGNMSKAIQPLINGFKTAFGQLPGLFSSIGLTIGPIIETIGNAFGKLNFSGIQNLITALIPAIQNAFQTMMTIVKPAIDDVISSFSRLWNAARPVITALGQMLMPVLQVVGAFLGGVFKGVLLAVAGTFDVLSGVIRFLTPVFQVLVNVFKAVAPVLTVIAQWIGTLIGLFGGFGGAGNTLKTIMSNTWNGIKTVISTSGNIIKTVIQAIKTVFSALGSAGGSLKGLLSAAWSGIKGAVSSAGSVIKSTVNGVKSVFTALGSAGSSLKSLLSSAWSGIVSAVSNAKSSISGIISGIKSTFNSLGHINLSSAGRAIMEGFLGGLKSAFENVKNFVGGIANWIRKHKGPISYDRKLLIPAGNAIMDGLNEGLKSTFENVKGTVSGVAGSIKDTITNKFGTVELPITTSGDPDFGFDGQGADFTATSQLITSQSGNDGDLATAQPANITLVMGRSTFSAYVDDISGEQDKTVQLKKFKL